MNFYPTKTKIIISVIPLVLFILFMAILRFQIENPFTILILFAEMIISIPLVPIIESIGFAKTPAGAWWPNLETLIMVTVLWGIIIYVLISLFSKPKNNNI